MDCANFKTIRYLPVFQAGIKQTSCLQVLPGCAALWPGTSAFEKTMFLTT